jgi:hypothetical protein
MLLLDSFVPISHREATLPLCKRLAHQKDESGCLIGHFDEALRDVEFSKQTSIVVLFVRGLSVLSMQRVSLVCRRLLHPSSSPTLIELSERKASRTEEIRDA